MKLCPTCKEGALDTAKHCPRCEGRLDAFTYRPGNELHGMLLQEKYLLDKFLQEGGMGWVYRATQLDLQRDVAVKLMKPASNLHRHRVLRFEREAYAASRLNHPHIISILDFGRTPGELLFNVTELVRGVTLTELLRYNGALPFPRVLRIFAQLLAAVEEAHRKNVIHRDLKPDNIMVTRLPSREDFIKVLDFGIAKIVATQTAPVTLEGEVCGTPAYMAPEQIRRTAISAATDIYACGVILFELLTGTVPLEGGTLEETFSMQLHDQPPPLLDAISDGSVPAGVQDLVCRAMAKSPSERYHNVSEMRDALFRIATAGDTSGACTACHRRQGSMLGTCSEHCESGAEPEVIFELTERTPSALTAEEKLPGPSPPVVVTDPSLDLRRVTTGSEEAEDAAIAAGLSDTIDTRLSSEELLLHQPDMLNRARENDKICRFLAEDQAVLEIVGPAGTGKTTLLLEVSRQARLEGRGVLVAGPDPSLARTPWLPVQQLVRQALGLHSDRPHPHVLLQHAPEMGLSSDDAARLSHLFKGPKDDQVEDAEVFFREISGTAIRALLYRQGKTRRDCILVDDAGDLDQASHRFLRLLCQAAVATPMKVVLATDRPIMPADARYEGLYLGPVRAEEIGALLKTRVVRHREHLDAALECFKRQAAGSLLFVDQAARFHSEGGQDPVPTLESMVCWRLERLKPAPRRLLDTLCVIGASATMEQLERVLGESQGASRRALLRGGWLKSWPLDPLTLAHPALGEIVRLATDVRLSRRLHGRVLRMMETLEGQTQVLARHAYEAGAGQRSLDLLETAGDQASDSDDCEAAALVYYRRAVEVARREIGLEREDPRCLRLMLKMGGCLRRAGHLLAAEVALEEALGYAGEGSVVHAQLLLQRGFLRQRRGQQDLAEEDLRRSVEVAGDSAPEVMLQASLALASIIDDRGSARHELELGIRAAVSQPMGQRPPSLWRALLRLAELQRGDGQPMAARATTAEALDTACHVGTQVGEATARRLMGELELELKNRDAARESLEGAASLFRRLGDRQSTAGCLLLLARLQPEDRRSLAARAMRLAMQVHWQDGISAARKLRTRALSRSPIEDTT